MMKCCFPLGHFFNKLGTKQATDTTDLTFRERNPLADPLIQSLNNTSQRVNTILTTELARTPSLTQNIQEDILKCYDKIKQNKLYHTANPHVDLSASQYFDDALNKTKTLINQNANNQTLWEILIQPLSDLQNTYTMRGTETENVYIAQHSYQVLGFVEMKLKKITKEIDAQIIECNLTKNKLDAIKTTLKSQSYDNYKKQGKLTPMIMPLIRPETIENSRKITASRKALVNSSKRVNLTRLTEDTWI